MGDQTQRFDNLEANLNKIRDNCLQCRTETSEFVGSTNQCLQQMNEALKKLDDRYAELTKWYYSLDKRVALISLVVSGFVSVVGSVGSALLVHYLTK